MSKIPIEAARTVKNLQLGSHGTGLPVPAWVRSFSDKPGSGSGDSDNNGNGGHWGDKVMAFVGLKSKDGSPPRGGKGPEGGEEDAAPSTAATVEADVPSTSALVPSSPELKYKKVLAVELQRKPLFPGIFYPVTVTKNEKMIKEIVEQRRQGGQAYVAAFLRRPESGLKDGLEEADAKDAAGHMYEVGTFAQVHAVVTGDNADSAQLLLAGHRRVRRTATTTNDPLRVAIQHLKDAPYKQDDIFKAKCMEIVNTMRELMTLSPLYGEQFKTMMQLFAVDLNDPSRLTDIGASLSTADEATLQTVLETLSVPDRADKVLLLLKKEVELVKIQADIREQVESKIMKEQRKMLLMEQMRSIKKELGLEKDDKAALMQRFQQRWDPKKDAAPEDVRRVVQDELEKLSGLEPVSPEFNVTRNYLEWLTVLPWGIFSKEIFDITHARQVLDEDHYGLDDVKKRILEFIAVSRLRGSAQGKILCLVGPPGVGKTSVGRSIARTLHRKYYRFSVGGLYDVAEIKGHRRTYVGAMPGKLVQCLKSTQTSNPLVLIDEIDKLGRGHAGDPASALLELLDPEQNSGFLDHYLDVPIDLSKVLFVCTANVLDTIPGPLLDRMEVIRIAGYTEDEKRHIARQYLEVQAAKDAGIPTGSCSITDAAMHALISDYNREAGVRNLKKNLEQIYRKVALKLVEAGAKGPKDDEEQAAVGTTGASDGAAAPLEVVVTTAEDKAQQEQATASYSGEPVLVDAPALKDYVGPAPFHKDRFYETTPPGVVTGLAWTAMGGASLYVEASKVYESEAKGSMQTTGQLGDVMKESASIAHTFARGFLATVDPHNHFFSTSAIHVHVPAGATPKDGPSAGCTMITALMSLAVNKPVAPDLAMTGEVTLTGRLLPIGGVKEKLLAARRSGIRTVIFPEANRKDYEELSADIREGVTTHFVTHYSEIFKLALEYDAPIQAVPAAR